MITAEVIMPSPALRPFVHHYWVMKASEMRMSTIIMPVGCMRWMFHRKRPFVVDGHTDFSTRASATGLYDKALRISTDEPVEMLAVFFHPHVSKAVMGGVPGKEFTADNVDMGQLESIGFKDLKARVLEADNTDDCIGMIEDFVLKQVIKTQDSVYLQPLAHVFGIMAANPDVRIDELASAACLSERQFRRVFVDNVGMTPKQLQRIMRFHLATTELLHHGDDSLEDVLFKYGYTDHSHFNHEFHDIVGMSPTEYKAFLNTVHSRGIMPVYRSYHAPKD